MIPLRSLGKEAGNAEPARLAIVPGAVGGAHRIFDDILTGRGGLQLGLGRETAGEDHSGHGTRRGAAERARGGSNAVGGAHERAQGRGKGRHSDVLGEGVLDSRAKARE